MLTILGLLLGLSAPSVFAGAGVELPSTRFVICRSHATIDGAEGMINEALRSGMPVKLAKSDPHTRQMAGPLGEAQLIAIKTISPPALVYAAGKFTLCISAMAN